MPLSRPIEAIPDPRPQIDQDAYRNGFTSGDWTTEKESEVAFDAIVPSELFDVHPQVWGSLVQPRAGQQVDKQMRIDRVLVPTNRLLDLGWKFGIIGCELKRSGEKIGPAIAQAMDYSRAVWTLQPSRFRVWLDYIFIWPMPKQSGPVASICAQNRIGSVTGSTEYGNFQLKSGETSLLVVNPGRVRVGKIECGAKVGSR